MPAWDMLDRPDYLDGLKALGLTVEEIDYRPCAPIFMPNHVGWNTRLENGRWVPTFPKSAVSDVGARTIGISKQLNGRNPAQPVNRGSFTDSVLPVMEHGQAQLVDAGRGSDADLGDHIWLESAPGHTIGNMNVFVEGAGRSACMSGDVIHHPIQCVHPELYNNADYDKEKAARHPSGPCSTAAPKTERCYWLDISPILPRVRVISNWQQLPPSIFER